MELIGESVLIGFLVFAAIVFSVRAVVEEE